jgi:hypothetical protein
LFFQFYISLTFLLSTHMASSTAKRSLCKICNKQPSVFFCGGCQNGFCTDHAKEHRQELSRQLETIIIEHDQLKQNLAECVAKPSHHPLMNEIDKWEKQSIDKIRRAADDARKQLLSATGSRTTKVTEELKHLTQELTTARSENNFIEIDLQEWMEKLQKWTNDLNTAPSINIRQETSDTPFIQKIVVSLKNNAFFERSAGNVKIEDNGQVITAHSNDSYSTVRCQGDYSSGQHTFCFKIEHMSLNNWMYFGIVSKNAPLQASSYNTSTTFGWITNNHVSLNGFLQGGYNNYKSDMVQNDTLELFLDCDRRMIRLTNERTSNKHEIPVNITGCPFPWQLSIGLYYQNDRVRCLSA